MKRITVIQVLKKNDYGNVGYISGSEYSQGYFSYRVTEHPECAKEVTEFLLKCLNSRKIVYNIETYEYDLKIVQCLTNRNLDEDI